IGLMARPERVLTWGRLLRAERGEGRQAAGASSMRPAGQQTEPAGSNPGGWRAGGSGEGVGAGWWGTCTPRAEEGKTGRPVYLFHPLSLAPKCWSGKRERWVQEFVPLRAGANALINLRAGWLVERGRSRGMPPPRVLWS